MVALVSTGTELLLIALAVWVSIGVTLSVVMGRRGHNPFTWLILGAILGPIVLPLVRSAVRDEDGQQDRPVAEGIPGEGPVDVLVGFDGSEQSQAALRSATALLGTRIGRLTVAAVVDFEGATSQHPWEDEERAIASIEGLAVSEGARKAGAVLLSGQPATALMKHAREEGYELLAIGKRGHGRSKALLGSTASRLAHGTEVPVLIV